MKTVVIYGCGYSLNELSDEQWQELKQYDSIGFNWFIHQKWIEPTHMLVGDIVPDKSIKILGNNMDETIEQYKIAASHKRYENTKFYEFEEMHETFTDKIGKSVIRMKFDDIEWSKGTTTLALCLAKQLGYERVIYAGVDFYDYRFFFLDKDQLRIPIARNQNKGKYVKRKLDKPHPVYKKILQFFEQRSILYNNIEIWSYNPRSLLLKSNNIKPWESKNG